jgi:hypothetical protein
MRAQFILVGLAVVLLTSTAAHASEWYMITLNNDCKPIEEWIKPIAKDVDFPVHTPNDLLRVLHDAGDEDAVITMHPGIGGRDLAIIQFKPGDKGFVLINDFDICQAVAASMRENRG